jgi:hypothetical protein
MKLKVGAKSLCSEVQGALGLLAPTSVRVRLNAT